MRGRLIWAGVILIILALDWAALHDILKGEPDPVMEWIMLAISAPILFWAFRKAIRRPDRGSA